MNIVAYVSVCVFLLTVFAFFLVRRYARPNTHGVVLALVSVSYILVFSLIYLLPLDLVPDKDKAALSLCWKIIYGSSFVLTWLVIPIVYEYYEAGEFTFTTRLVRSFRVNALFFAAGLAICIAGIVYLAVVGSLRSGELRGVVIGLANAWGLILATLLLGYGLVEVPRTLYRSGDRAMRLRRLHFNASHINNGMSDVTEQINDLALAVRTARTRLKTASSSPLARARGHDLSTLLPHVDIIESHLPDSDVLAMCAQSSVGGVSSFHDSALAARLNDRDRPLDARTLAKLHFAVKRAVVEWELVSSQWDETIDEALELDALIGAAKDGSAPRWSGSIVRAVRWRWRVRALPVIVRIAAIVCAGGSALLLWSEVTMLIRADVSPLSHAYQAYRTNATMMQAIAIPPLAYLCFCAFYALFSLRLSKFYEMHPKRRTDERSLLFNASYLLRLAAPLGHNFFTLVRADGTVFQNVIGDMDAIPFLSTGASRYIALIIGIFCAATFFNVAGKVMRCLGISRFNYAVGNGDDDNDDDNEAALSEGQSLIRREKRNRQRNGGIASAADGGVPTMSDDPNADVSAIELNSRSQATGGTTLL